MGSAVPIPCRYADSQDALYCAAVEVGQYFTVHTEQQPPQVEEPLSSCLCDHTYTYGV